MGKRFFENLDALADFVVNGGVVDTGCGYTDGDHPTWVMEQQSDASDKLDIVNLAYVLSGHIKTPEHGRRAQAYLNSLCMGVLVFNIEQSDTLDPELLEDVIDAL